MTNDIIKLTILSVTLGVTACGGEQLESRTSAASLTPSTTTAPTGLARQIAPRRNETVQLSKPKFIWTPVPGATSHVVEVWDDLYKVAEAEVSTVDAWCDGGAWCHFDGIELPKGRYFWKVAGKNAGGTGPVTWLVPFEVDPIAPPGDIRPLGPTGSAPTAPTLSWTPAARADGYGLAVFDTNGFVAWHALSAAEVGCEVGTTCRFALGGHLAPGTASFHVVGMNVAGYGNFAGLDFTVVAP